MIQQKYSYSWVLVTPTCSVNYLGGRHWEDHSLRPAGAKKFETGVPIIPAGSGSINRRIAVQASHSKKQDLISKITTAKRVWKR
jgi:hypothetical protein